MEINSKELKSKINNKIKIEDNKSYPFRVQASLRTKRSAEIQCTE